MYHIIQMDVIIWSRVTRDDIQRITMIWLFDYFVDFFFSSFYRRLDDQMNEPKNISNISISLIM